MFSKLTSAIAIGIGIMPAASALYNRLVKDRAQDLPGLQNDLQTLYIGFNSQGQFSMDRLALGWGAIGAGIAFKKGMGYLLRIARF